MIELLTALTLGADVALLVLAACWLLERATGGRRRPLTRIAAMLERDHLRLAWLVAAVAMGGSLCFSEVRHFTPCVLCWYQRIAMYPMVLLLGIAVLRDDRAIRRYAVPLALIGAAVGIYHYQLERFPDQDAIACTSAVPCTTIWFEQLGFVTIPFMATSAFLLIAALLTLGGRHGQVSTDQG